MGKLLITGGAGFIGSTLAKRLAPTHDIIVVDDLSMGQTANLAGVPNIEFYEESVLNEAFMTKLFRSEQFDYIFHLAAIASVADSVARPVATHRVNFDSTLLILELIKTYQPALKRIVFSSSAAVYGDDPTLPKDEQAPIKPLSPYAVDKFASETYLLNAYALYGVRASAARFFNVYGINQNPSSPYSGVISIMMSKYLEQLAGETTRFTFFGEGHQTRDFVFVEDVCRALLLIAESEEALGQVYNIGNGVETSLLTLKAELDDLFGLTLPTHHAAAREGDIERSVATITKLKSLGYEPHYTFKEGLRIYIEHERKQLQEK